MWIRASSEFQFEVRSPTPLIFMLRPRSGAQQWVASESYTLTPNVPVVEVTDKYGNLCQRIVAPPGGAWARRRLLDWSLETLSGGRVLIGFDFSLCTYLFPADGIHSQSEGVPSGVVRPLCALGKGFRLVSSVCLFLCLFVCMLVCLFVFVLFVCSPSLL